jgi:AraC-like DNA-binding protein
MKDGDLDRLRSPTDYFRGVTAREICRPDNVLVFKRDTRKALQRRALRQRPHHRFILLVNFRTNGYVSVDSQILRLDQGDAILLFPLQFYHYLDLEKESLLWLFLTFEDPTPNELEILRYRVLRLDAFHLGLVRGIAARFASDPNPVREDNALVARVALLIEELKTLANKTSGSRVLVQPMPLKAASLLSKINHQLSASLEEGVAIKRLAGAVHVSESSLRRQFREYFGVSLGEYLHEYQINRAIAIMRKGEMRLGEIALHCGFGSQASFSRAFRRRTGMPPRDYLGKVH